MHFVRSIALAATTLLAIGHLSTAAAQSAEASSTGKGIVGGTLLGAEAVLITEAALDVSPTWLYYIGGGAGAIGGGIGGYFLEDSLSPKANMLLLASGMLLAIPTTVAVLSATAYEQPADYTQDQSPSDELKAEPVVAIPTGTSTTTTPPSSGVSPTDSSPTGGAPPPTPNTTPSPGAPGGASPSAPPPTGPTSRVWRRQPQKHLPHTLVAVDAHSNLHLGIPAVEVRETYSRSELQRFGLQQRSELRVPLLQVAF